MSQYFRIEVDQPATSSKGAKPWVWTPDSEVIESAEVELRKEGKRISTLHVTFWDKKENRQWWPIANALPDPAFADVPMRLYLSKPSEGQAASKLVFDGKVASIQPGWPAPSMTAVVAHDRSLDLRLKAAYRTFKNVTSTQLAARIGQEYGYEIDTSELVGVLLTQRLADIGLGGVGLGAMSDWQHITRALAVDGLELYMAGKKIKIRRTAQVVYPHVFQPDDGLVIEFKPTVNHVSSPGAGGQSKVPAPAGTKGQVLSAQGDVKKETDAEGSDASTHRTHPQGPKAGHSGAHTESTGDNAGPSTQRRKRKDEATLVVWGLPDLGVQHQVKTLGWGGKFDRTWHVVGIKHMIAGQGPLTTSLTLSSEPQGAAQKQIGIIPAGTKS